MCFWIVFLEKVFSTSCPGLTHETMSTFSLIGEKMRLKLGNRSMALIGNLVTKPGFTDDKHCVVRLISRGCRSVAGWWAGRSGVAQCPKFCAAQQPLLHYVRPVFPLAPAVFWATLDAVFHKVAL